MSGLRRGFEMASTESFEVPRLKQRGIFDLRVIVSVLNSLVKPSASPPAVSAIKIGGRAAGGPFGWNALAVSVQGIRASGFLP
jgi:hypothetical protein